MSPKIFSLPLLMGVLLTPLNGFANAVPQVDTLAPKMNFFPLSKARSFNGLPANAPAARPHSPAPARSELPAAVKKAPSAASNTPISDALRAEMIRDIFDAE